MSEGIKEKPKLKSLEELKEEKLKSQEIKVEKPNLKVLRKNQNFMKTIYDQMYIGSNWNLSQVAQHLTEMTGTSVTGKTIGNDFKKFGFKLKSARRKAVGLPPSDLDGVDLSGLKNWEEKLFVIQSLESFYKMRKWNAIAGAGRVVPKEVLEIIESIVLEGLGLEKIREHGKELAEKDKEIRKLKERIVKLENARDSFDMAIKSFKATQTPLGKNPLSETV